jgi:hypothetical protein
MKVKLKAYLLGPFGEKLISVIVVRSIIIIVLYFAHTDLLFYSALGKNIVLWNPSYH